MPLNNPSAQLSVAEVNVFSGTPPTFAWTDLDLSAVVGHRKALVILKVKFGSSGTGAIGFRKKGDVDEFYDTALDEMGAGCALVHQGGTIWNAVVVCTDVGGKIQWKAEGAHADSEVDVIAYVK